MAWLSLTPGLPSCTPRLCLSLSGRPRDLGFSLGPWMTPGALLQFADRMPSTIKLPKCARCCQPFSSGWSHPVSGNSLDSRLVHSAPCIILNPLEGSSPALVTIVPFLPQRIRYFRRVWISAQVETYSLDFPRTPSGPGLRPLDGAFLI